MNLADVYSYLESLRRGTTGLLSNPSDTLNQWGSQINEDLGKYDQGNARTMGLLSDPVLGGGSAPGAAAWQNNGPLGSGLLGALHIAYHGTPHVFDKFDMSKVGTGEGAQAYGHGLYFAENPQTAQVYRNIGADETRALAAHVKAELAKPNPNMQWVADANKRIAERTNSGLSKDVGGAVYKVDINADPAHYLDWDKPLSQQSSHVQEALGASDQQAGLVNQMPTVTGGDLYHQLALSNGMDNRAQVSAFLRAQGIPGIKYKDAGSRAADGGTHNYVLFDDSLINNLGAQP